MNRASPWLMWVFPLFFFGFQFILRLFPGLVMPEIMEKFQVNATQYGLFASVYYFGYAGFQIPVAIFLDKIGAKITIFACIVLCSFASWLMTSTELWTVALVSRFLIGIGSAVGFLGVSKVISQNFPNRWYGRMVGLSFSFGLVGALYGGKPISMLNQQYSWESVLLYLAWVGFAVAIGVLFCVRSKQETLTTQPSLLKELKKIMTNKALIALALGNFLMVGALEGFADVWGVSYFVSTFSIEKSQAAGLTSLIFFGMLFGGPLLAYISEKFNAHYWVTALSGLGMAGLFFLLLIFKAQLPFWMVQGIMFMTGLLCCYQVIVFAIGAQLVQAASLSIAIAFLNCINMLGGSFFHSCIGGLMDLFWDGQFLENGTKLYSPHVMSYALGLIPLAAVIGSGLVVWALKLKSHPLRACAG